MHDSISSIIIEGGEGGERGAGDWAAGKWGRSGGVMSNTS